MRVVVTRPAAEGQVWANALLAAGHEVLQLPLIQIATAPIPDEIRKFWTRLPQFHAVMFVSANAVAGFFAHHPVEKTARTFSAAMPRMWATGPGTVRALLAQGLPLALIDAPADTAQQFDSEALWDTVRCQIKGGERVLIVRGAGSTGPETTALGVGRDWLASALTQTGAAVEFCASYQRKRPELTTQQLTQVHQWVNADQAQALVWLFSSSEAIDNLALALPGWSWRLARAVCTHPRIAERARTHGFGVVRQSRPTLDDVVASIESLT